MCIKLSVWPDALSLSLSLSIRNATFAILLSATTKLYELIAVLVVPFCRDFTQKCCNHQMEWRRETVLTLPKPLHEIINF